MDLQPGARVERYIVKSVLGKGGMATVYLVEHAELGTPFALKVIDLPSRMVRDRLMSEGKIQARLVHPNIVRVFDTTEVDGCPALVLEHIDGPALDDMLESGGFTLDEADHLAQGILRGVRAAHEKGLIHRDLKPGNILLARTPEGLVPKIADFGLAKVGDAERTGASHTRTGQVMGTPAYMAPEQFRNAKDVDVRADVWALGVVLYELVTGVRPFPGDDLFVLHEQVHAGTYPPPAERVPALPPRMAAAIASALVVDASARCPDVATLLTVWRGGAETSAPGATFHGNTLERAGRLAAAKASGPLAQPPPPPPVASAPARRPWWLAAGLLFGFGTAAAAGVVLLGAVVAVWAGLSADAPLQPEPVAVVTEPPTPAPQPPAPAPEPVRPQPAPAPPPVPSTPPAAPKPAPTVTGTVTVSGEVDAVVLVSSSGKVYAPGPVPPGVYQVRATFSGADHTMLKPISVADGQITRLSCVPAFKTCQAR